MNAVQGDRQSHRRQQELANLLDRLAAERGPLDTADDQAEIARFMRLLGGSAEKPA
jgi:hypothetical protein